MGTKAQTIIFIFFEEPDLSPFQVPVCVELELQPKPF
jgi:hypothetical protein